MGFALLNYFGSQTLEKKSSDKKEEWSWIKQAEKVQKHEGAKKTYKFTYSTEIRRK